MNEILWRFNTLVPVASVGASEFSIANTGIASIVAYSAASEVGDLAHIYFNGADVAQNQRGYNLVVIDPVTRKVDASVTFDTFASAEESARLVEFIDKIPAGKIVAAAVRDEASRNLTDAAVQALQSLGAQENLRGKWRWSHALIGLKGARIGSVDELPFPSLSRDGIDRQTSHFGLGCPRRARRADRTGADVQLHRTATVLGRVRSC